MSSNKYHYNIEKIKKFKNPIVINKTSGHCGYCGKFIGTKYTIDHVIPKSHIYYLFYKNSKIPKFLEHLVGDIDNINHIDNFIPSCDKCNNTKNDLSLEEFRKKHFASGYIFYFEKKINNNNFINKNKKIFYKN